MAAQIKINFQPLSATLPTGYLKDSGEAYSATRGYGWITQSSLSTTHTPLDISANARERDRTGVDQRLDTLLHMQFPNTAAAAWEYAIPNGTYSITISVGDQPNGSGRYDSNHSIRIENISAINRFQSNAKQEYQLATTKVNISDGRLTIDAIGGTNTKLNYLEIVNITPGKHPSISSSAIAKDATGVYLNAAVNVDVSLPTVGAGVNPASLNTTNVKLYRTRDNQLVPGIVGTSGGNDTIVYQPRGRLEPNTNYTFRITDAVKDQSGATFIPYSTTFNTGTNVSTPASEVRFTKSIEYTGANADPISSLVISPDGNKLYAATLDGKLRRWNIEANSGNLTNPEVFAPSRLRNRAIIGLTFDPNNASNLWISHNNPLFPQPAADFSGKISKLTLNGTNFANTGTQDYVVGLPRSAKDHLSNSLVFSPGPNAKLYMTQGSNSAMGAADPAWFNRPERLLNGAVLEIDPRRNAPVGGFDVQTEGLGVKNYNPFAANAPVKIFATGVRNAYDLVWHSQNGNLYVPTNGSAANGNTPDNPNTPVNEGLNKVAAQNDYLFKVERDGYYGHPNPLRREYILNGGNPTSSVDPAEVVAKTGYSGYRVGTNPESNYQGFAYDFGRSRSPNGIIEYKSNTFGGVLKNKLLVTEYSGGDDILALDPGANGNISRGNVTQVISGLTNPLDLIEDTKKNIGNLYVAELINDGAAGQISLLKA